MVMRIADTLVQICSKHKIPYVFKASYAKANRTSIDSFVGPGPETGLKILDKVKTEFNVPVLTDIHLPEEAHTAAEVVDILQIPAFLCRQTELLISAGETGKVVNIKKGQFLAPADMAQVAKKVASTGNRQVLLTERGTTFGYNNLVVDFRAFMDMHKTGYPIIYDATHSLQRPSVSGTVSGGQPEYVKQMSMAAVATGTLSGLFIETHPNPSQALSDAQSMLPLDEIEDLLVQVKKIEQISK
jgi:2-dehydro-3-deoxyphosphooctonate aldolase (KDO 8-P synthase)